MDGFQIIRGENEQQNAPAQREVQMPQEERIQGNVQVPQLDFAQSAVQVSREQYEEARKDETREEMRAYLEHRKQVSEIDHPEAGYHYQKEDSVKATKREMKTIADKLSDETVLMHEEDRARLEVRQDRSLSHLLVNSTRTLGDSREMIRIKEGLKALERALQKRRSLDFPMSKEDIEGLENLYIRVIDRCSAYLTHPKKDTKNERYSMVRNRMEHLMDERALICTMKEYVGIPEYDQYFRVDCQESFLVGAKLLALNVKKQKSAKEEKANKEKKQVEAKAPEMMLSTKAENLEPYDPPTQEMFRILCMTSNPSELIKKQEDDHQDISVFLLNILKGFPEGAHTVFFNSGMAGYRGEGPMRSYKRGTKTKRASTCIGLKQAEDGTLSVIVNGVEKFLPFQKDSIIRNISTDFLDNEELVGQKTVNTALDWIKDRSLLKTDTSAVREVCIKLLEKRTGVRSIDFDNVPTDYLLNFAEICLNRVIAPSALRDYVLAYDANNQQTKRKVNNLETLEKLKTRELHPDEIADTLVFDEIEAQKKAEEEAKKKAEEEAKKKAEEEAKKKAEEEEKKKKEGMSFANLFSAVTSFFNSGSDDEEEKEEEKKEDKKEELKWTEEERAVRDLLADLVFSKDTWKADATIKKPGERMRSILKENTKAFILFLKDDGMASSMLHKLPLPGTMADKLTELFGQVRKEYIDQDTLNQINAAYLAGKFEKTRDKAEEAILEALDGEQFTEMLVNIESQIDITIDEEAEEVQSYIAGAVETLFKKNDDDEPVNVDELYRSKKGLTPEQKRELEKKGNERLKNIAKEALFGEKGQGKFLKLILSNYFSGVSTMDKRAMLASMIREAEPSTEKINEKVFESFGKKEEDKKVAGEGMTEKIEEEISTSTKQGMTEKMEEEISTSTRHGMTEKMDEDGEEDEQLIGEQIQEEKQTEAQINTDGLTKEQKEEQEKLEKEALAIAGRYIGGLFKGAGPLFQKFLQGVPKEALPKELHKAFEDVKSNLLPIPQEVVEAQLYSIVKSSKGKITKIEVVKPLGAASVGQAFDCKIFGPNLPADGDAVVIKLLRPDVRNRMMREKQLMLNLAYETNQGMGKTYEGQLQRIEEELDLTIEARNVQRGQIYDKQLDHQANDVVSMKLHKDISPTKSAMVISKAEGETIDRYMKKVQEEQAKIFGEYAERTADGDPIFENGVIKLKSEEIKVEDLFKIRAALSKLISEVEPRQVHLLRAARKWVQEGLFGSGFYHGDLHAGNIMVSKEKATIIDFGNSTQLDETQRTIVTKMMCATAIGDVDAFRHGFHQLMNPENDQEKEKFYQKQRAKFTEELSKLFKLGNAGSSGLRIWDSLLVAQELGLELPAPIFNFSQCQIRLQNTIEEMSTQLDGMMKLMKEKLHNENDGYDQSIDVVHSLDSYLRCHNDLASDILVNTQTSLRKHAFPYPEEFQQLLEQSSKEDREVFDKFFTGPIDDSKYEEIHKGALELHKDIVDTGMSIPTIEKADGIFKQVKKDNPEIYEKLDAVIRDREATPEKIEEVLTEYHESYFFPAMLKKYRDAQDKGTLSPEELKELGQKVEKSYQDYNDDCENNTVQKVSRLVNYPADELATIFSSPERLIKLSDERIEKDIVPYFSVPKYGKELEALWTKFTTEINANEEFVKSKEAKYITRDMKIVYAKIQLLAVADFMKKVKPEKEADYTKESPDGFNEVMGTVLNDNLYQAASRLGWWGLWHRSEFMNGIG